ncbi:MAG: conjugal transfer protein TraR [Desulfobacteraceae bacterium]|nr:conjugal transfer protein TraR [Desulfobacteraceae bacterium]
MEEEKKRKLKQHILEKLESLKKEIASFKQLTKPISPDNAIGRLTRMEAISNKSINEAALEKSKNTLTKLERILATIDEPGFGCCSQCEEPIAYARLMAVPESDLCIQCAKKLDA